MNKIFREIEEVNQLLCQAEKKLEIIIDRLDTEGKKSVSADIENDVLDNVINAQCRLSEAKDILFGPEI